MFHIRALRNILCLCGNLKYDYVGKVKYNTSLKYTCVCLCVPTKIMEYTFLIDLQSTTTPRMHLILPQAYRSFISNAIPYTSHKRSLLLHKTPHILTLLYPGSGLLLGTYRGFCSLGEWIRTSG